jgi:hypothetical protein
LMIDNGSYCNGISKAVVVVTQHTTTCVVCKSLT